MARPPSTPALAQRRRCAEPALARRGGCAATPKVERARRPGSAAVAIALAATALALAPRGAPAQRTDRIVSVTHSTQAYALFVPSDPRPEEPRPLLVVLDPQGRAVPAMEPFLPAAERLGWIVASAYGSRSDAPDDPTPAALGAVLDDVQTRVAVDPRRLYLAGFSGTARTGWAVSTALADYLAGLVSVGAGPGVPAYTIPLTYPEHLAVFLASGRLDFNFEEVEIVAASLRRSPMLHRLAHFDGGHAWMPPGRAAEALEWLELQAMRRGLREVDPAWVARRFAVDLARVDTLLARNRIVEAAALLEGMTRDFDGLVVTRPARARRASLDPEVLARARRDRSRQAEEFREFEVDMRREMERVHRDPMPVEGRVAEVARGIAAALDLQSSLSRSLSEDRGEAEHARRMLEAAFVRLSLYEPRAARAAGRPALAEAFLLAAEVIRPVGDPPPPDSPDVPGRSS